MKIVEKGDYAIELDQETNEYSVVNTQTLVVKAKSKNLLEMKGALELLLNGKNKFLCFQTPYAPAVRTIILVKKKESSIGNCYWVDSYGDKHYGGLKVFSEDALLKANQLLAEHEEWMSRWFKLANSLKDLKELETSDYRKAERKETRDYNEQ